MRSIALLRATLTSHARGLDGNSAAGQRSSAAAKASCKASSARSKSPTRRISVASARPASSRNTFSISTGGILSSVVVDHHGANLDRTALGAGNSRSNSNRGVEILGLDQVIAAELLAGFGERPV